MTTGKKLKDKETSLWNDQVQEAVKRKTEAWKERHIYKNEKSKCKYKEANKKAKVAVAHANREASENIYRKLETNEGGIHQHGIQDSKAERSSYKGCATE